MNWRDEVVGGSIPVILSSRPARNRPRQFSEHAHREIMYIQDSRQLLDPTAAAAYGAGLQRSRSAAGHGRHSPAQIVINNPPPDDHSPVRNHRRRSQHVYYGEDDSWDEEERAQRHGGRRHARSRGRRYGSRTPSPVRDAEIEKQVDVEQRLKKLEILEQKEREEEQRRIYKQEQIVKAAKEAEEKRKEEEMKKRAVEEYNQKYKQEQALKAEKAAEEKKKEEELKKRAVEEYNHKQAEKAAKEKKDKEEADKAFRERVKTTFAAAGYSAESIERILAKEGKGEKEGQKKIMDLTRPTYIKVHRKHLSPDTLDAYSLPWEWDEVSDLTPISEAWRYHVQAELTNDGAARRQLYCHQAMDPRNPAGRVVRAHSPDA